MIQSTRVSGRKERSIINDVSSSNLMCSMEMLDVIHFSSLPRGAGQLFDLGEQT